MLDLVIRGGTVVDGSGKPGFRADVGVKDGRIVGLGRVTESAKKTIDADGHVVTPGFIDGHTHMDAQFNWDPLGTSSCWHGITTAVMGNCGFTLAPSKDGQRELVLRNLERAEDISAAAMTAGIKWKWETFPEYLDVLEGMPKGINYAGYMGHSALRTWAMGERAFTEEATPDDLAKMTRQLEDALKAGAIGLSTSRSMHHITTDGRPVASRVASWDEVRHLVLAMGRRGRGIFSLAHEERLRLDDEADRKDYFDKLLALALESRVPFTSGIVAGRYWKNLLKLFDDMDAAGARMYGQSRSWGLARMLSFRTKLAFDRLPEWKEVRSKPVEEQQHLFRDPAVRQRLVHAAHTGDYGTALGPEARKPDWNMIRVYRQPIPPNPTVAELAAARGVDPVEYMMDLAIENYDQLFIETAAEKSEDAEILGTMKHPWSSMTFTDAGAHVTQVLTSMQTFMLAYWVRKRELMTLEEAVRKITYMPALTWGFEDRGVLAEGKIADINVFDPKTVAPAMPHIATDLPAGAKRFVQRAHGFLATVVNGEVLLDKGEHTGALPGRLLRR